MTPLYSKETAEYVAHYHRRYPPFVAPEELNAICRLIENGNEVMGVLASVEQVLKNEGYAGMSIVVSDLIKKIKGEG